MLAILMFAAMLQSEVKQSKPEAQEAKEVKILTAAEFCQLASERRRQLIDDLEKKLADLPSQNDYSKLSAEAKKKLEKPIKDQLAVVRQSTLNWVDRTPDIAAEGEVFKLPRTNRRLAINDQYQVEKTIDATSVLAVHVVEVKKQVVSGSGRVTPAVYQYNRVVIEGLKPSEFVEKPGAHIKLSGTWQRLDSIKIDGKTHVRIARWPHEEAAKKMWPQFLKDREEAKR